MSKQNRTTDVAEPATEIINELDRLRSENSRLKAERDGFALAVESALQEKLYWKVQADTAYIKGLERSKELIRSMVSHKVIDAIQTEIESKT